MGKNSEKGRYTTPEGSRTWEYISATFSAVGAFSIGCVIGWNSPSLSELKAPNSRIPITPEDASTLSACMSIGHVLALPLSILTVDRIGRKNSMLLSTVPLMVGWGLILAAENVTVLIIARILAGISLGMMVSTSPIYMAEILSSNIRGSLSAISGTTASIAMLFMFGIAPYLGMQITASICMGFSAIYAVCFWFIPESPYFLVKVGRIEEAEAALEKLRGKTDVTEELELIKTTIQDKGKSLIKSDDAEKGIAPTEQSAFKQLFTVRGNLKAFGIGMILTTLDHFCGSRTIVLYCHVIFEAIGADLNVYVATIIFSTLQVFTTILTAVVVDRFGRRPLLITSGLITGILLVTVATYFFLMEHLHMDVKRYWMIPLASIFIMMMTINMGISTVTGTLMAEIFAPNVKMLSICIIGLAGSLMSICIAKSYLLMASTWGLGHSTPFFSYALSTFICTVVLMRILPETKGRTLLEIQKELND